MNGTLGVNGDVAIDQQNVLHLAVELRIAPFQVVTDLVRLNVMLIQNSPDGTLACLCQARMSRHFSAFADEPRQRRNRPQFGRQPMIFRFGAGNADHPGFRLVSNFWLMRSVIGILEPGAHARRKRLVDALVDHRAPYAHPTHQVADRCSIGVAEKNFGSLDLTYRRRPRSRKFHEHRSLLPRQHQCRTLCLPGHDHSHQELHKDHDHYRLFCNFIDGTNY